MDAALEMLHNSPRSGAARSGRHRPQCHGSILSGVADHQRLLPLIWAGVDAYPSRENYLQSSTNFGGSQSWGGLTTRSTLIDNILRLAEANFNQAAPVIAASPPAPGHANSLFGFRHGAEAVELWRSRAESQILQVVFEGSPLLLRIFGQVAVIQNPQTERK